MNIENGSFGIFTEDYGPRIYAPDFSTLVGDVSAQSSTGARIANGRFLTIDNSGNLNIYNTNIVSIYNEAITPASPLFIRASATKFYILSDDGFQNWTLEIRDENGAVDSTIPNIFTGINVGSFDVTDNDTILYYFEDSSLDTIKRYDIPGLAPLPDFITYATYEAQNILVLPDETVMISWSVAADEGIHYSSAAVILHSMSGTYLRHLALDVDRSSLGFWAIINASTSSNYYTFAGGGAINLTTELDGHVVNSFFVMAESSVVVNDDSGVYSLVPSKRNDTLSTSGQVAIPNSYTILYLTGDE